ncbi:hypothetical protein C0995_013992 [Termitomyces sp. Mi166|nr:hypothetical protein C0995_013992 [Termitomyces sp. Mi166\
MLKYHRRLEKEFSSVQSTALYRKMKPAVEVLGFDGDELRDLVNDLWTLHDNFYSGEDDDLDSSSIGEDEAL